MNLLDIDFQKLIDPVMYAFIHVYGEQYSDLIYQKIKHTCFISYYDFEGLDSYVFYLKRCKSRELCLRFLDAIGIKIDHNINNYSDKLSEKIAPFLDDLIDITFGFSKLRFFYNPLCAFDEENHELEYIVQKNKVSLINYFLKDKDKKIDSKQLSSFMKTDEYLEILDKIQEYKTIYDLLYQEYCEWEKILKPYEDFIRQDRERKNSIYKEKRRELFLAIYEVLPKAVKSFLQNKDIEEQQNIVFGISNISCPTLVESFSEESMKKLDDTNNSIFDRLLEIGFLQKSYFNNFGITVPFNNLYNCDTEEKFSGYLDFLKQDDVKKYIPNQDAIVFIKKMREKKTAEALQEYIGCRSDIQKINDEFSFSPEFIQIVSGIIKRKEICVAASYGVDGDNIIPFICHTIRTGEGGYLDYILLHECGHAIDKSKDGCGLEPNYTYNDDAKRNPYDSKYRIYEKFNETINDIFTLEALEYLHSEDVYLLEPKEIIQLKYDDVNTHRTIKNIVMPLVEEYRDIVIASKVHSDVSFLAQYIGEDNFEALVDVVNHVDYLCRNGLDRKLKESPNDSMCLDYQKELERASDIYTAIDEYTSTRNSNPSYRPKERTRVFS